MHKTKLQCGVNRTSDEGAQCGEYANLTHLAPRTSHLANRKSYLVHRTSHYGLYSELLRNCWELVRFIISWRVQSGWFFI